MIIDNFYIKDGYHIDVKIIEIKNNKLNIKKIIYLDIKIVETLLETSKIDFTSLFVNKKIKIIEIYSDKFIITRENNENWNLVLAIFFATISNFFSNFDYKKILAVTETKLSNYQEYQLKNLDHKIIIYNIYHAINKKFKDVFEAHNGGFEIIELNMLVKKIHIRLLGSCSNCTQQKEYLKSVIIKEIEKILYNYQVYFYN